MECNTGTLVMDWLLETAVHLWPGVQQPLSPFWLGNSAQFAALLGIYTQFVGQLLSAQILLQNLQSQTSYSFWLNAKQFGGA